MYLFLDFTLIIVFAVRQQCTAWVSALSTHKHSSKQKNPVVKPKQKATIHSNSNSSIKGDPYIHNNRISHTYIYIMQEQQLVLYRNTVRIQVATSMPTSIYMTMVPSAASRRSRCCLLSVSMTPKHRREQDCCRHRPVLPSAHTYSTRTWYVWYIYQVCVCVILLLLLLPVYRVYVYCL